MREIINLLIDDFHERALPEVMPRDQSMVRASGKANVIIGMRRSGKTWFCYQQMRQLIEAGIPKERLIYFNFEDERLLPFSTQDFQLILETYFKKFPDYKELPCYLFLDEVHRIEGWDRFVRRILDTENIFVTITGSSSKLLSTEIATTLRGRSLTTEIFPFSFTEFLRFNGMDTGSIKQFGTKTRASLQYHIENYSRNGGFPEVQPLEDETRREVLRNYVDVVLFRDVVERYGVKNIVALRALLRHIMSAPSTRFSVNKFYHSLRSQGISCTKNNLYAYLAHLEDAFLLYQVPIHTRSEKVRRVNPSKIYLIDLGLLHTMSVQMTKDYGALLENLIYMHLRRMGKTPEYYVTKNGEEVDFFVTADNKNGPSLIQVCWDMQQRKTQEREIRALINAMDEFRINRSTIVTWMDESQIEERVKIEPAWKWLLSDRLLN